MSGEQTPERWRCDVLVIGAGPAGTAAAITGARAGLDVVVVDRARFPRDKCCGDGLTTGALRHLEHLGLDGATLPSWTTIDQVHLRSPAGREVELPLPDDGGAYGAVCRRTELDAALVDLARAAGVSVLEGHELTEASIGAGGVSAVAGEVTFEARFAVAADGMWSPTRKLLGFGSPGYRGDWHAFRQYFTGVTGPARQRLQVWFEADLLPGYAWSFPLRDGAINVGFGIHRGGDHRVQDMKRLWPDLLERPHVRNALGDGAVAESPHRAWPIPAQLGGLPLTAGPVLFVGDAATAADPMTGEGIGQALETGQLAVESILRHPRDAALVGARYEKGLTAGMVRDHRLAGLLSRVLSHRSLAEAAIAATATTGWTRRQFGRWLFEDYPRAALFTPGRWNRELLRPRGAYEEPPTPALR